MVYNKTKRRLRRRRVKRRRAIRRTKRRIKSRRRVRKRTRRGGFNQANFSLSEIGEAPFSKEIMKKLY